MRKKQYVEVKTTYKVTYDPDSPNFQNTLTDYRACIDGGADPEDIIKRACDHITWHGAESMIEGVGYVRYNGVLDGTPYSGIDIEDYDDEAEVWDADEEEEDDEEAEA